MRRSDREVVEWEAKLDILKRCDVCRLAFNDGDCPYIVPLNFAVAEGDKATLYFHSALEGRKLDFVRKKCRASFEADCSHKLSSDAKRGYCTMDYESVIGKGSVESVTDETEKLDALNRIVLKYHPDGFLFSRSAVPRTAVFKLTVDEMTGKKHITEKS